MPALVALERFHGYVIKAFGESRITLDRSIHRTIVKRLVEITCLRGESL